MNVQARIKEMALAGHFHPEVAAELTHLRPPTVRVYFNNIVLGFTPEERAQMDEARAKRAAVDRGGVYHQKFRERRVLGPVHVRIGRQLLQARHEAGMNLGDFSRHWGFSNRVTLSAMEQGYHDFTVTEIYQISDILGLPAEDLLKPPTAPGIT